MRVHSENVRPRLLPTLGAVPAVAQSGVWVESAGWIRRRLKPPGSLVVHSPLLPILVWG
jgi:hypothetical protein